MSLYPIANWKIIHIILSRQISLPSQSLSLSYSHAPRCYGADMTSGETSGWGTDDVRDTPSFLKRVSILLVVSVINMVNKTLPENVCYEFIYYALVNRHMQT